MRLIMGVKCWMHMGLITLHCMELVCSYDWTIDAFELRIAFGKLKLYEYVMIKFMQTWLSHSVKQYVLRV